jgi:hypothetical protein
MSQSWKSKHAKSSTSNGTTDEINIVFKRKGIWDLSASDLKHSSIYVEGNVPFDETIAPLMAPQPLLSLINHLQKPRQCLATLKTTLKWHLATLKATQMAH